MAITVIDGFTVTNESPIDQRLVFTSSNVLFVESDTDPLPAVRRYLGMEVYVTTHTCSYTLISGDPRIGGGINNGVWCTGSVSSSYSLYAEYTSLASSSISSSYFSGSNIIANDINVISLTASNIDISTASIQLLSATGSLFGTSSNSISSSYSFRTDYTNLTEASDDNEYNITFADVGTDYSLVLVDEGEFIYIPSRHSLFINNGSVTASLFGTSSWSVSSSWAPFPSIAISSLFASQSVIATSSLYASHSQWSVSSSLASSSLTASYLPNALYQITAAYATNADQLDGNHGQFYQTASNLLSGVLPIARLTGSYTITSSWALNAISSSYFSGSNLIVLNADIKSLNATGSLFGTSSWSQNSVTASYIQTGGISIFREIKTLDSEALSGSEVILPNNKQYVTGSNGLSIYLNGILQYPPEEYIEIGSSSISFTYDVPTGAKILFYNIG
jgi:hypothetical protein